MIPIISFIYGCNLERILVKIFMKLITVVCLENYWLVLLSFFSIGNVIDSFHSWGNFSLLWMELRTLWFSKHNVSPLVWISSAGIWSILGDLCLLNFTIAISTSKVLGSGTNGSAICTVACRPVAGRQRDKQIFKSCYCVTPSQTNMFLMATNPHATIQALLETQFSMRSMPRLYSEDEWGKLVLASELWHQHRSWRISIIESCYQTMTREDYKRFRLSMCCSDL
jgi:hypothetical protein